MSGQRVAAIDCGTNSIRLLVADIDDDGSLSEIERTMQIVRLGEGVDKTGSLQESALQRTFSAAEAFAERIRIHRAGSVRFIATSATRDAANREIFVSGIEQRMGVTPEVIGGDEEATLSFTGATRDLGAVGAQSPYLVVDIGGGSTEFVMGDSETGVSAARSVDVGCVRMTERHFRSDPPWPAEVAAARDDIDAAIKQVAASMPLRSVGTLIGLAGSVTTVAALSLGLWEYDPARIHQATITAADVHRVCEELLYSNRDKRLAQTVIHPGRIDVIAAGSLILSAIVAYTGVHELMVSEHDILDGIALSIAR
ncbi:MAG TPA: Ppx/GppA phosphatase family protein [Actinomycetes bacterium]|nr:Ppx/GppA phosphatase family protein [Actinomycetes bacterium]